MGCDGRYSKQLFTVFFFLIFYDVIVTAAITARMTPSCWSWMRVWQIVYFCVVKCSEGSSCFIHCFDVRILKWYVGINHIPCFIYAGIYPRTKLKIVLLSYSIGKYVDKIFRLNDSHRFFGFKNPILYLLKNSQYKILISLSSDIFLFWYVSVFC